MLHVVALAVAVASTPAATPTLTTCTVLPIGGVGSVAGVNGAVAFDTPSRQLRLDGRAIRTMNSTSVTLRAACQSGTTDYLLIATAGGASCPVRYQVAEIAPRRAARFSREFGSCAEGAGATIAANGFLVTMPNAAGSATNVTYRYAKGEIVAVAAPVQIVERTLPAPVAVDRGRKPVPLLASWTGAEACAVLTRGGGGTAALRSSDIVLGNFERSWPADWRSRGALRDQPFTPTVLRRTVTELACLSALPGGDKLVSKASLALFSSRRHGPAAFEQLDEVARGAGIEPPIRTAARSFHAQMRFEVDNPRFQ